MQLRDATDVSDRSAARASRRARGWRPDRGEDPVARKARWAAETEKAFELFAGTRAADRRAHRVALDEPDTDGSKVSRWQGEVDAAFNRAS